MEPIQSPSKSSPTSLPFISVVLSFYNEESVLPELIRRLRQVFRKERQKGMIRGHELVFVNDNSTDRSLEILLEEFHRERTLLFSTCPGILESPNACWPACSIRKETRSSTWTRTCKTPRIDPHADRGMGEGRGGGGRLYNPSQPAGEHPLKMFITKWGYRFINAVSDIRLPVDSGDFKLLSRRAVKELLQLKEKKPYLRGLVSWIGFKQAQVFYHREARYDGRTQTKFPVFEPESHLRLFGPGPYFFFRCPLKGLLVHGFFVSCGALLYILVVIFQKIMGWYVPGWPAIMATMLFLGGIQLIMLGVFGLYINTIFLESKKRPNYIIKSIVAPDERNQP